ncbi:VOC family protein [Marinobacterium jannaschii]|uniref:VOC family protein n=1 Tax=Marinobacterium jannaschii TaxID=64970 RepID=UPI000688B829|nr:VOC family protein [Marinobacterium jannaschii]
MPINNLFSIVALDHVVLVATDLPGMELFYTRRLGCQVVRRVEEIGLVQLKAGSSLIDLLPAATARVAGERYSNMDHLCIQITPFEVPALMEAFHDCLEGEVETRFGAQGFGLSLYIRDPEGNKVELKEGQGQRHHMT